jgi:hypothetical protein
MRRPPWLTGNARTYVAWVLQRQKVTVLKLNEAGMPTDAIRFVCHQAVGQARLLPNKIKDHRERARLAQATLKVLPTVRTFVTKLYSSDAKIMQDIDVKEATVAVLDRLEADAKRYQKASPAAYGASRQTDIESRWDAVRVAIGGLALEIQGWTGSPNWVLVANLVNELFPGARPDGPHDKKRMIDEETVRQCRKAVAKTWPKGYFPAQV